MCDEQEKDWNKEEMQQGLRDFVPVMTPKVSLVAFESGHYKKVTGKWKGDSVWTHFIKSDGKQVHINKNKVEYIEEL